MADHDAPTPLTTTRGADGRFLPGAEGRFLPGQSGNISGRPHGLVRAVQRKAGKDGRKLVEGLWLLAYGTPAEREKHFGQPVEVTAKDRLTALSELLDRGWGRPAQQLSVDAGGGYVALVVAAASRMNEQLPAAPALPALEGETAPPADDRESER